MAGMTHPATRPFSGEPTTHSAAPQTPAAFCQWLHGDLRYRVFLAQARAIEPTPQSEQSASKWHHHLLRSADAAQSFATVDRLFAGTTDTYVMLHETRAWRVAEQVNCLKAMVVDLDCHEPSSPSPQMALDDALRRLKAAELPLPNLALFTGRGVQLFWRLQRVGLRRKERNAAVRWVVLQKALAEACGPRADRQVCDLPRLIRTPGTYNSKAPQTRTHSIWVDNTIASHQFDQLCDAYLPVTRQVCCQTKPAEKPAKPRARAANQTHFESAQCKAAARRLKDFEHIAHACAVTGVPEGYRDTFAFLAACDLVWTLPFSFQHNPMDQVIDRLKFMGVVADHRSRQSSRGRVNQPLSVVEARRNLQPVIRRFEAARKGETVIWGEAKKDPRYWHRSDSIWEKLAPMISLVPGLRDELDELCPRPQRLNRAKQRHTNARRSRDATRNRVEEGRYRKPHRTHDERLEAMAKMNAGASIGDVAIQFAVSQRTVRNWMKMREACLEPRGIANPPVVVMPSNGTEYGQAAGKNRPPLYMALPNPADLPNALRQEIATLPSFVPEPKHKPVVGQPKCGQPHQGLSITQGVSAGCGQGQNRLAGHPQPRAVDDGLVHIAQALCRSMGGFGGARGGATRSAI